MGNQTISGTISKKIPSLEFWDLIFPRFGLARIMGEASFSLGLTQQNIDERLRIFLIFFN